MQKEVNKEVNKQNVYLCILDVFRNHSGTKEICYRLQITKQALHRYLKFLKRIGIIEKKGYATWQISPFFESKTNEEILQFIDDNKRSKQDFSIGTRSPTKINLHALNIKIPILKGETNLEGYEIQLNNWKQQIKKYPTLKITLRNNNNKSIEVFLWSREVYGPDIIPPLCSFTVHKVAQMLEGQGVLIDYFGWRVTTLHLMIRNEDFDKILNKSVKIEVVLSRNVEKITERDITQEAKAWIDSSPYKGIETNDIAYYRNYIMMPEHIAKASYSMDKLLTEFTPAIKELSVNMKTHVSVMKGIEQSFKRFNRLLSERQKKLGEWL